MIIEQHEQRSLQGQIADWQAISSMHAAMNPEIAAHAQGEIDRLTVELEGDEAKKSPKQE